MITIFAAHRKPARHSLALQRHGSADPRAYSSPARRMRRFRKTARSRPEDWPPACFMRTSAFCAACCWVSIHGATVTTSIRARTR